MINSIGNLAGFAGPYAMGWIRDATGSYAGGLLSLAAAGLIAGIIVIVLGHDHSLERAPAVNVDDLDRSRRRVNVHGCTNSGTPSARC